MGYKQTSDGERIIATEKSDSTKVTIVSHNWADPCTWYQSSVRAVDEVATHVSDYQTYQVNTSIIDLYHGKVSDEDFLKDDDGYSYTVTVKVNDTTKTEQDPHYSTGGDFTVDYLDGYIQFLSPLDPADVVKVTYHYATTSDFTVKPTAGKRLKIVAVEVQFSVDIQMTDSCVFQPYGYVEAFAPQYSPVPYPAGTLIPLGNASVYKTMSDYLNSSFKAYATYPAIGGNTWRGMTQDTVVMDWDYVSNTVLESSKGMRVVIKNQHDEALGGAYATATFYCTSESE